MQRSFAGADWTVPKRRTVAVDLFCGAGGLTRGLLDTGMSVVAGYDIDVACKYAYEHNNKPARFIDKSVMDLSGAEVNSWYPEGAWRVLVGCAPCQPFSRYAQACTSNAQKWALLDHFGRIVEEVLPDIVSMENVPDLQRHSVYDDFVATLKRLDYHVTGHIVYCPDYGLAQMRSRLVLFASRLGKIPLARRTHSEKRHRTVIDEIGGLPRLAAGEVCPSDPLHRCAGLAKINLERIQCSVPNGTWRDWPTRLVAECHKKKEGSHYSSVYGRMAWNEPSPTVTTQFYGFGSGRFGHPEQDRGLSLREGATLQSFGPRYEFVEPGKEVALTTVGRMIGNAVPVRLGQAVGRSIKAFLQKQVR